MPSDGADDLNYGALLQEVPRERIIRRLTHRATIVKMSRDVYITWHGKHYVAYS